MDALNILKTNKIKDTIQRIKELEYLMNSTMHPSAEDIYLHLKNELPIISLSSIYNILIEFEKKNIINKLMTDRNVIRYDINKEKHFHLYYPDGSIEDLEDKDLENLLSEYFKNKYPQSEKSGDIDVIRNLKNEKQPTKK